MATSYIGIGSNIGDRGKNIEKAIELLSLKTEIISISSIYETEPLYYPTQPFFLNCALLLNTKYSPEQLFDITRNIEKELGRIKTVRFGPRTIDLDILFYDNLILNIGDLIIPHPKIIERKFVLLPLMEIAPNFVHPVLNKTIEELFSAVEDKSEVHEFSKKCCQELPSESS